MQNIYSNSSLFLVINMIITKIAISFWLFRTFIGIITFLFVNKVFNMAQVLSFVLVFWEIVVALTHIANKSQQFA